MKINIRNIKGHCWLKSERWWTMIFHPLAILLELKISHILGKKNQTIISQLIKCKSVESRQYTWFVQFNYLGKRWFVKIAKFKVAQYSFLRSIPPKFERKLRRHKQRFGKIDTTVVLDKEEICYDQGCNDIGVAIATKWRHYLFYLQQYFSALGTVLPKSFTGAFTYDSCLDVREV